VNPLFEGPQFCLCVILQFFYVVLQGPARRNDVIWVGGVS